MNAKELERFLEYQNGLFNQIKIEDENNTISAYLISTSNDLETKKSILKHHIQLTKNSLKQMVSNYFLKKEKDITNKIKIKRKIHEMNIDKELKLLLYENKIELDTYQYEFLKDVTLLNDNIKIAEAMGYIEPTFPVVSMANNTYGVKISIPSYLYGSKILKRQLQDFLNNKEITYKSKLSNNISNIDNIKLKYDDSFIPDMIELTTKADLHKTIYQSLKENNNVEFIKISLMNIKNINIDSKIIIFFMGILGAILGFVVGSYNYQKSIRSNS